MRVYTKHIKVLGLTKLEISLLRDMITEAERGVTVITEAERGVTINYSERQVAPNEYFGISVSPQNEYTPKIPLAHRS